MRALSLLLIAGLTALAQVGNPQFDVVSVRPAAPGARMGNLMQGGPGTPDPTRFTGTNVMLSTILLNAFGIRSDQLNAPDWVSSPDLRFDIAATVPAGATKDQLGMMLQNMLIDRFHLAYHRTRKEFPVYALTVAPGGPKLKPAAPQGRPTPGMRIMASCEGDRMTANGRDATGIAQALQSAVGDRVVDKTGLTGTYDIDLYFGVDRSLGGGPMNCAGKSLDAPPVFEAVQKQLGLKLEKGSSILDVIVVDKMDKTPVEN